MEMGKVEAVRHPLLHVCTIKHDALSLQWTVRRMWWRHQQHWRESTHRNRTTTKNSCHRLVSRNMMTFIIDGGSVLVSATPTAVSNDADEVSRHRNFAWWCIIVFSKGWWFAQQKQGRWRHQSYCTNISSSATSSPEAKHEKKLLHKWYTGD